MRCIGEVGKGSIRKGRRRAARGNMGRWCCASRHRLRFLNGGIRPFQCWIVAVGGNGRWEHLWKNGKDDNDFIVTSCAIALLYVQKTQCNLQEHKAHSSHSDRLRLWSFYGIL